MARPKKPAPVGVFRNLSEMDGHPGLYQFDVKDSKGTWHTLTNLGGESEEVRKEFCQKTADRWIKR